MPTLTTDEKKIFCVTGIYPPNMKYMYDKVVGYDIQQPDLIRSYGYYTFNLFLEISNETQYR